MYTIVLFLGTFLFFRSSPIGVVAITQMAAGDGIADIIGRYYQDRQHAMLFYGYCYNCCVFIREGNNQSKVYLSSIVTQ